MADMNNAQSREHLSRLCRSAAPRIHPLQLTALALFCAGYFFSTLPATAKDIPSCLPPVLSSDLFVVRLAKNNDLISRNGQVVKLEGLLWPDQGLKSATTMQQAHERLGELVFGQRLTVRAREPKLDRYNRLRAEGLRSDGVWLQQTLLREGLARVSLAPSRGECARELYAAESEAREARRGLWAVAAYAIRTPESLHWSDLGTFQLVEGRILNSRISGGRAYLNFGRNWRTDFTVTISPEDMKTFRRAGLDPYGYADKTVRVRGYVDRLHGFEIEVGSPEAIEILGGPT